MATFSWSIILFLLWVINQVTQSGAMDNDGFITGAKKTNKKLDNAKQYMEELCEKFATAFKPIFSKDHSQFSVITLEQITLPPSEINLNRLPMIAPPNGWNAWYTGLPNSNGVIHRELVFIKQLPCLLARFAEAHGRFPTDIYLYTYFIPCPECAKEIINSVKTIIPEAIKDIIKNDPNQRLGPWNDSYNQMQHMTLWLSWSKVRGDSKVIADTEKELMSLSSKDENRPKLFSFKMPKTAQKCLITKTQ